MRERDWTDRALTTPEDLGDLRLAPLLLPEDAVLVSGNLEAACADLTGRVLAGHNLAGCNMTGLPPLPQAGLAGPVDHTPCLIRIARDRGLVLGAQPPAAWGWHPAGYATSPASDLYTGVVLSGPAADYVMAQGTAVDLTTPRSPSAAVQFAGETVLILRWQGDWVIWVPAPRAVTLASWLREADRVLP